MITLVTKEAVPYVPTFDREKEIQSVFWITPMTAGESSAYRARWKAAQEEYNVPLAKRAENAIKVDRDELANRLGKVDNCGEVGRTVEGEELVAVIADGFDFAVVQELMVAAQNMSLLEAGRKKF